MLRASATGSTAKSRAESRQQLLANHVGLVHHVARGLAKHLSTQAELDELVSAGSVGLVQAADAFDAGRGLSFSTYAVPRIRGAMLDELRKLDRVPRNVRRRTRDVTRARDGLSASLQRQPTAAEVATQLGIEPDMLRKWELDAEASVECSFDQPTRADGFATTIGDMIADEDAPSPDDLLTREVEVAQLKRAIEALKPQERTVLALNYFEELRLQDIATVLGLSVCRISQIRTAALAKLRVQLNELRAA